MTLRESPVRTPGDAPIGLAVAPHGAVESDTLPEALGTPTGPGADARWTAEFGSVDPVETLDR